MCCVEYIFNGLILLTPHNRCSCWYCQVPSALTLTPLWHFRIYHQMTLFLPFRPGVMLTSSRINKDGERERKKKKAFHLSKTLSNLTMSPMNPLSCDSLPAVQIRWLVFHFNGAQQICSVCMQLNVFSAIWDKTAFHTRTHAHKQAQVLILSGTIRNHCRKTGDKRCMKINWASSDFTV